VSRQATIPTLSVKGNNFAATNTKNIKFPNDVGIGCYPTYLKDVWYKFTATSTVHWLRLYDIRSTTADNNYNVQFNVYQGTSDSMWAVNNVCYGSKIQRLTDLTLGKTYFVRVSSGTTNTNSCQFRLAAFTETATNTDGCATAQAISATSLNVTQSNNATLPTLAGGSCESSIPTQNTVWYSFTAPSDRVVVTVQDVFDWKDKITPTITPFYIALMDEFCNLTSVPCRLALKKSDYGFLNLEKGKKYYVIFQSYPGNFENFSFSIRDLKPVPQTDCNYALVPPINPTMTLTQTIQDTVHKVIINTDNAHWFKFVATAKRHFFNVRNAKNAEVRMSACTDNCNITPSFEIYDTTLLCNNLTIGYTYYVPLYVAPYSNQSVYFQVGLTTPEAASSFDDCSGAMLLTATNDAIPTNFKSINFVNLNSDTLGNGLCQNIAEDAWFKFTATSAQHILTIKNYVLAPSLYTSNDNVLPIQLLAGSNCNQLTAKNCYLSIKNNQSKEFSEQFNQLTVGQTYFIKILFWGTLNKGVFDIALSGAATPPSNDLCSNATTIPINPTLVANNKITGNTKNSTSNLPNTNSSDVWFKFTPTSATHILIFKSKSNNYYDLELRKGSCDTTATVLYDYSFNDSLQILSNLTIGATYFIRYIAPNGVFDNPYTAYLTTPKSPVNDKCSSAIALTISANETCTTQQQGTIAWSNAEPPNFDVISDVWYKFVATAKNHRIQVVSVNNSTFVYGSPLRVRVYEGSDCNNLDYPNFSELRTFWKDNAANNIVRDLAIGTTYYVQVAQSDFDYSYTGLDFTICATTPQVPNNPLDCSASFVLPVSDTSFCTNYLAVNTKNIPIENEIYPIQSKKVWYKFVAKSENQQLKIKDIVTDATYKIRIFYSLFEECSQNTTALYAGEYNQYNADSIWQKLAVGKTYYVALSLEKNLPYGTYQQFLPNANTTFDIAIATWQLAKNDETTGAQIVPINTSWTCQQTVQGNTATATSNPQSAYSSCGGYIDDDLWYKFTATNKTHFITLNNIKATFGDVVDMSYELYADVDIVNNSYSPLGCSATRPYLSAPWTLEVGKTYYLRLYTNYRSNYSRCSFELCITTPIPQDEFEDAVPTLLFVNNDTETTENQVCMKSAIASSIGATYSYNAGIPSSTCDQNQLPKDIWFKTTMTTGKPNLSFRFVQTPTGADARALAYRLKNNKLQLLPSNNCPTDSLRNLSKGDTILFRVWDANGTKFGNYEICLNEFGKPTTTNDAPQDTKRDISIYPVPVGDEMTVNISNLPIGNLTATISNLIGQKVYKQSFYKQEEQNLIQISTSSLPQGNYILSISDGLNVYNRLFVKL
jgi:large repetitive protein